jgi:hypothetical protein
METQWDAAPDWKLNWQLDWKLKMILRLEYW